MSVQAYVNLTSVYGTTNPGFNLGSTYEENGNTWMFVKGGATCAAYKAVITTVAYTIQTVTTALATSVVSVIGIPQFDILVNEFAWIPVGPFFKKADGTNFYVTAATLDAVDVPQYTTATGGLIDDTATVQIQGLRLLATNASGATANTACCAAGRLRVNG